jgi:hypothetical protein
VAGVSQVAAHLSPASPPPQVSGKADAGKAPLSLSKKNKKKKNKLVDVTVAEAKRRKEEEEAKKRKEEEERKKKKKKKADDSDDDSDDSDVRLPPHCLTTSLPPHLPRPTAHTC